MKALSLTQPYANWIASGLKTIETRTWKTNYRGPILICSTKKKFYDRAGSLVGPNGMALCIVDILDCMPMTKDDEEEACIEWADNKWAWPLVNLRRIEPFPVKGQLSIFNVDYLESK